MKLSIITINYNDAAGLERTICSVISQTFNDYQYIVIDGNSTDGGKDILKKYAESIDIAISEPDGGIYNAMNKGALHAKGEYLLFLNSGDSLYDNTVLERLFQISFDEDIVCGNVLNYSVNDAYIKVPPKNISFFTFVEGSLPHPSALIKRSLFESIGGYIETYKVVSDWCFFIEAVIENNCTYRTVSCIITKFNRFGISSNSAQLNSEERRDFLEKRYSRILPDYLSGKDEAMMNCVYWIHSLPPLLKRITILPFKILNRLLHLRNKLSRRIGTYKVRKYRFDKSNR